MELLVMVLGFLAEDPTELAAAGRTCRTWATAATEVVLKKNINTSIYVRFFFL